MSCTHLCTVFDSPDSIKSCKFAFSTATPICSQCAKKVLSNNSLGLVGFSVTLTRGFCPLLAQWASEEFKLEKYCRIRYILGLVEMMYIIARAVPV